MQNPFESDRWQEFSKEHHREIVIGQYVGVFVLGLICAWFLFGPSGHSTADKANAAATGPQMWTCSMHPQIRQTKPGTCPLCGMDLIPVVKSAGGMRTLAVSPESRALMNIQTAPVERRYVTHEIRMVGKVDYDETKLGYITAWVPGRLDRLYVNYTGVEVKKGDHMVYIYSEELYTAQQELIQAIKYAKTNRSPSGTRRLDLVEASREKLRLLGLTDEQIKEIEAKNKPSDHMTIYSKVDGIVIEKLKQEGERVRVGDRIYTIADLSKVWVHLDAYESDLTWLRYGQQAIVTTEAYPGEHFVGRIDFIQRVLDDKTRTVKVRVNVPNSDGKLKPEMFVRGFVRARVAAGGRVMDPNLAGKWISPMHPEIVKDEPGKCDICGMALVRAENLGFVSAETDDKARPLVIPKSAALVTGTRAVVYVELPTMPPGLEPAYQALSGAVEHGKMEHEGHDPIEDIRDGFETLNNILDRPFEPGATDHARELWNQLADRMSADVTKGLRVESVDAAEKILTSLSKTFDEVRESFAPSNQPTFEGREIVLGPRAGDYYLVRHGLREGELIVTQGNFKVDAEIQLQAKPSMMTPEGGGGGGHDHGGTADKKSGEGTDGHAGHKMALPEDFYDQLRNLSKAYDQVTVAMKGENIRKIKATFGKFGTSLSAVDVQLLTGNPRMVWKEFAMLLSNDVVEGRDLTELAEADRVYVLLKGHMRRMREQLGITQDERKLKRIEVAVEFQRQLAKLWHSYLPIQASLAGDDFKKAHESLVAVEDALSSIDDQPLNDHARRVWQREKKNLTKLVEGMQAAKDIKAIRAEFSPFSEEIGVLVKTFGFGDAGPVYELYCSMAFNNRGAIWFQNNDKKRNPYFGATMLTCANRVELITQDAVPSETEHQHDQHNGHQHKP